MAKRKLLNLRFIGNSSKLLGDFIDNNKSYIFRETHAGIKQALRQNKSIAEICSVNTDSAIAIIEKEGWENALSSSLGYFESVDEFETCKDIHHTLKLLHHVRSTEQSKKISRPVTTS
jgi:hypothetical protein